MSRGRAIYLLVSVILCAYIGYTVDAAIGSNDHEPIRFALRIANASESQLPRTPSYAVVEEFPYVTCQWPDERMSITVAAAHTFDCFPTGRGKFPIPGANSFALLASPIAGAKYPVQNGSLSDDLRFVHLSENHSVIDVGAVLLQFGDYSGGARPSFFEDDGSLWIFDVWTEHGAEVIRVSTATGSILQRTTMPAISRPTISVNRSGFWLGQDSDSLFAKSAELGVWLAPIGASKGVRVSATSGNIFAMQPSGRSMDVYLAPDWDLGSGSIKRWRFTPAAS